VKGLRKLVNYQNKLAEYNSWRRRASPEDIEYQEIEIGEQVLSLVDPRTYLAVL
jgi:hypothetical protein